MLDIDLNAMIWEILMSATMRAAIHLGQDYQENIHYTKNTDFEKIKRLFDISQKLILGESQEIFGISNIDWNNRAVKLSQRFSFSLIRYFVLTKLLSIRDQSSLGKTTLSGSRSPLNIVNWIVLMENRLCSSGKFPGHKTLHWLRTIQRTMEENRILPEKFADRIIFMSMYNDIGWRKGEDK